MKRFLSLLLSLALTISLAAPVLASDGEANAAANALYERGLFSGTGTDTNGNPIFDLDRAPTRHEAVTMLVRLLGKTSEAENGAWNTPFTDVAIISYRSLDIPHKSGSSTLREESPTQPVIPIANDIPEDKKMQLLDAYAEKMYYVAVSSVYLLNVRSAASEYSVSDTIYWTGMVRTAYQDECAALEKMKTLCGDYANTVELKKCIEEDIRLKSMGPQSINSMEDAGSFMKTITDSDYSNAYRANVDAMKAQLYTFFSEEAVTNAVNQYREKRIAEMG